MTVKTVANLQSEVSKLRHELQTLNVEDETPHIAGEQVFIANYLLERLAQLGAKVCFAFFFANVPNLTSRSKCLVFPETLTSVRISLYAFNQLELIDASSIRLLG